MKILFIAFIVAIVAFAAGVWYTREYPATLTPVENTDITPTTPATTTSATPQATYINASADKIVVTAPLPGTKVGNTFAVTGKARGGWYFEASFPLNVLSATNTLLKEMPVQAQGDWMTVEFVPFSTDVTIPAHYKGAATLVLKNDNPSGLPENEASISIPITIE